MLTFPTAFPSDAISTGLTLYRSGEIVKKQRTFGECVWNVGGFGGNIALHDDGTAALSAPTLTDEEKDDLTEFVCACHAMANDKGIHAQKFGDGTFLKLILENLPALLELLKFFNIKLPGA